jgi:hypothetical protein
LSSLSDSFVGEAKKGGNSVVSLLWKKFLDVKGLRTPVGTPAHEINFVFDNCAGQNKNRMVMRFLFFLVKLKIARTARAIFLVKGHTKNDCDRMFNLMKYDYRKTNCYTPPELIELVNQHPQVTAIPMAANDFFDWEALQNKMIAKADGILKNHIFTVRNHDSDRMMIQEYDGSPITQQLLVQEAFCNIEDWSQLMNLTVTPLQDCPTSSVMSSILSGVALCPMIRSKGLFTSLESHRRALERRSLNRQPKQGRLVRSDLAVAIPLEICLPQKK